MAIKVFETGEKTFNSNGLGIISAISCIETKKISLNGWFIEADIPIRYLSLIEKDRILFVKTKEKGGQPFRICEIQNTEKVIRVKANHVVFDAEDYFLVDVRPTNANPTTFLKYVNDMTDKQSPFFTSSNISDNKTAYFVRKNLLEAFERAEELFGGSFDVDKFDVRLRSSVGNDDGFTVMYGKNLQGINVIENWSGVVTRLYPVGPSNLNFGESYFESEIQYEKPYTRTVTFDFPTSYTNDEGVDTPYTESELKNILKDKAIEYLKESQYPKINYSVKSNVEQSLRIGDLVHIKHPIASIKANVQSYTYDVISKRVKSLEFGNYIRDVKKVFDDIKDKIENAQNAANGVGWIVEKQTDIINNLNKNGLVYIDENEILILDKLPKADAIHVWRFGLGGVGYSSNGYNGPFEYAFTQDGTFNANFISAGTIQTDHLHSSVGSSLNISSNVAITQVVSSTEKIEENVLEITDENQRLGAELEDLAFRLECVDEDYRNLVDDNILTNEERTKLLEQFSNLNEDYLTFVALLITMFPGEQGGECLFDYSHLSSLRDELQAFLDVHLKISGIQYFPGHDFILLLRNYEKEFNRCNNLVQAIIKSQGDDTIEQVKTVSTMVQVLSDRFAVTIESMEQFGTFQEKVQSNMEFTEQGLIISKRYQNNGGDWVNGPFQSRFSEVELGFYENNERVAYISNKMLNIENAKVRGTFSFGVFGFVVDSNGSTSIKKVG